MESKISKLQSLAEIKDVDGFISVYVSIREGGDDVGSEASAMLSQMGENAIERVAAMLNDTSYSEDCRGTIANCLLRAIDFNVDIARTPNVFSELEKALDIGDSFISMNAAEALISIGVESVDGVPTREYARSKVNCRTSNDWSSLFNI